MELYYSMTKDLKNLINLTSGFTGEEIETQRR